MRRGVVLVGALLLLLAPASAAQAGRLDDAARALGAPGVWVDPELSWLVAPGAARRLEREIRAAGVPLRVAVVPRLEVDESRGDARAIMRAIIRRVNRDGLYVLVDQDGYVEYGARRLSLDLAISYSGYDTSIAETLAALVPSVLAARPAAPVSFEPEAADPVDESSESEQRDSLLGVAFGSTVFGALAGFALYLGMRAVVSFVAGVRRRWHA